MSHGMPGTHDILRDVSADIERTYAILPLFPRPHPLRSCVVAALATALYCRYVISRCRDDLDALIPLLTETLLLPHDPEAPSFSQITKLFYKLACSLAFRFEQSRSPEDLEYAIKYYRHLLALPPNAIVELNPLEVLDNLTKLLARRLQSTTEVQPDHADEMVGTLQKLAILDPSSEHVGSIAKIMGTILVARLSQYGRAEECDRALKLLTDIEKVCQPERSPEFYVAHGIALTIRFQQTSLYDHCSQAITRFNKSLTGTLLPSEHPLHPLALMGIATVLHHRFTHDKQLRSLEESITHSRTVLSSCPPGHLLRPACLALLSSSLRWRYAFFGNAVFLREADSCVDDALSQDLPEPLRVVVANVIDESNAFIGGFQRNDSLEALMEEMELQRQRLAKIPPGHPDQLDVLRSLALVCGGKFHRTQELADLEDEIEHHAMALAASPPDHYVRRLSLFSLGQAFQKRFLYDNQPRSLEESIRCCRDALALCPRGQMSRFEPLHTLALSLGLRSFSPSSSVLHRNMDFNESMTLFRSALDEAHAHPLARYRIANMWATCARVVRHPCTTLAYQTAISLMQSSLALGPTLPLQHRLFRKKWGELAAVPLDCASYYIEMGALKRAVESLEQGRTLLWSEMRGLRTSMDRLRLSDGDGAALAERFVAVSGELENIATSAEAPEDSERPRDDDEYHIPDAFGRMMEKVHELERKRAEIADQIRALPGFEDFLRAVPFDALQTAAACGPIVVINHCRYRCDILIVLHGSSPVHIPTVEDFYSRTIELKELLLSTRAKHPLESKQYQRALRFALEELYELVGRPVIEKLHELEIPEQSRVWWCPTSVLCSLPLHAAGPIDSDVRGKRYFSDVYVSSYTPTLSALIESRKGITHTPDPPSLLIVALPDVSLPGVWGEIDAVQKQATSATTLLGPRATQKSVTKQLPHHRMVHFACHGTLEPERPFDTAFLLHGGEERLSLLDIVRSRLSTAEFAMLSVCHAAEWTDANTPDEALHLTAAMQYCGFRSAVGTLWAMADTDGRDLAEHFYKRVFAEEERGVPLGERSARALRDAVRKLRKKKGLSLERWVNFVHYGA